jgi:hypothetical protein
MPQMVYTIQWKILYVITLELLETHNIIRMITISKSTPYLYYLPKCKKPLPFDHINQMITLSLITLSDFHCNITLFFTSFFQLAHTSDVSQRGDVVQRRSDENFGKLLKDFFAYLVDLVTFLLQ